MRTAFLAGIAALAAASVKAATTLPTITTKGSYFFTSTGARWFVKGVAYQLTSTDPLLDVTQCTLDAALMQTLGANAIRVYHVTSGDHSGCMSAFANAGIYLFVDLDTFTTQIEQTSPAWNTAQAAAFKIVMDEFATYNNTAGFFVGNEVLTNGTFSEAAAYVKASVRDMKAYRTTKGYRNIPIGYSHADVSALRPNLQNYLACGTNSSETIDFFGLNAYEWCGSSTYATSGYANLTSQVEAYPIPIFFSETGCNTPEPRTFADQTAIFGSLMTPYWSGAIVYEWIQETNHYGLITYGDETNALITPTGTSVVRSGTPVPVTPDFSNLLSVWSTLTPTGVSASAYVTSNTAPACPSYTASTWEIAGNIALPTLNEAYNAAVQYSITAGHLSGATATGTATSASTTGSKTTSASSSTKTGGAGRAASGSKEIIGMSAGLGAVMLTFIWWL